MIPLSIIVPTLNEAGMITETLERLQKMRQRGHEVLVVDGGSCDATARLADCLADRVLLAEPGRARQMNHGARHARHSVLLFLHADTRLPNRAEQVIAHALGQGYRWGRFDVRLSGERRLLRVVERMMNLRSCLTGIATGDQAIFVAKRAFQSVGGFPEIPLMEDIALSKALKRLTPPACIHQRVLSSSRRWEYHGVLRTILLMWRLRLAYFLGHEPTELAARYRRSEPE